MTEKKTFKNPKFVSGMSMKTPQYWEVHNEIYGESAGTFTRDEWDMEVTFTKKVKPIQINSVVKDLMGNTGRVVAAQADKVWVNYYLDDHGRAVDFDCVEWLTEISNVS